jgi:predicted CxxxxCH...CXXCH cytochrome family protein
MPPAPPHPQLSACATCHGQVVDDKNTIIAPERHVDGVVDVEESCDTCHGTGTLGAPPPDLAGSTEVSAIGVGAHAVHLSGGVASRPLACSECHLVPESAGDAGHLDASPHAEVIFSGVAESGGREPSWNRDVRRCASGFCHGPSAVSSVSPVWTESGPLACTSCHGMPPAAPHPQMDDCALCHGEVIDEAGTIVAPLRHVDGFIDLGLPVACQSCHGDAESAAPPADLEGNLATTFPGVGAHRAHLEGSGIARTLACGECHQVPTDILASGHIDSLAPAEVLFSGVAKAFGASPTYDGVTCTNSYCHGDSFPFGHDSGGTSKQPIWTQVDGTQKTCTSCHGLPPPFPHPPGPIFCSDCHDTVDITLKILHPERHVDGVVDLIDL